MPELSTPTSPTIPTIPTPPEPETASALEAKFTPRQLLSPQLKLVFGIALGLILLLTLIGLIYRSSRRPTPTPSPIPITTPTPAQASATTKDLRLGLLSFPYPDNWLVLFSPLVDAKTPNLTPVYFVRSEGEYRENALCASAGSCTETPLILTFSTPTEIWTGYSLPDFIRATMPDFPLDKMEQNTYAERAGLGGYTDLSSLTYQAVIRTGDSTFQTLTITAREDTREMLTLLVDYLNRTKALPPAVTKPADLFEPRAYTLQLTARLTTGEFPILMLLLNNLLAPSDPASAPTYFLYVEGTNAYPANYLDASYLLLTDNPDLAPGKYTSSQVTAIVTDAPKADFVPYLTDAKYCRESADCVYRPNFCTIDAYNRYHRFFTPWGCEASEYAGLGTETALMTSLKCSKTSEKIDITYDSLECLENKCTAQNPTPVCKKK